MKYTLEIDLPVKIGDKIWIDLSKGFGRCNFLDRYKNLQEVEIDDVSITHHLNGKTEVWFHYKGGESYHKVNNLVAFSKEQYYENWRKEIEDLIPEDLRNYLWK